MINIKELSIGNWIKISGTPVQILGIRTESQVYVLETEEADYAYAIDADIEPIEITPEILEKNGWDVCINGINPKKWIAYLVEEDALIVKGSDLVTITTNTGKEISFNYVHQLQNALTLCGINKEIEL